MIYICDQGVTCDRFDGGRLRCMQVIDVGRLMDLHNPAGSRLMCPGCRWQLLTRSRTDGSTVVLQQSHPGEEPTRYQVSAQSEAFHQDVSGERG